MLRSRMLMMSQLPPFFFGIWVKRVVSPGNRGGKWPLGGGDGKVLPPQTMSGDCPDRSCGGYKVGEHCGGGGVPSSRSSKGSCRGRQSSSTHLVAVQRSTLRLAGRRSAVPPSPGAAMEDWGKGALIRLGAWGCAGALLLGVVSVGVSRGGILLLANLPAVVPACRISVGMLVHSTGVGQSNSVK